MNIFSQYFMSVFVRSRGNFFSLTVDTLSRKILLFNYKHTKVQIFFREKIHKSLITFLFINIFFENTT